jgi:hypothetical protein
MEDFPNAYIHYSREISLPVYYDLVRCAGGHRDRRGEGQRARGAWAECMIKRAFDILFRRGAATFLVA